MLLARREVELARAEVKADLRRGRWIAILGGAGTALLVAALCCALIAAVLAIGLAWNPIWVALIGSAAFLLLALATGLLVWSEIRKMKPERSIRQAQQTMDLVRGPPTASVSEAKRTAALARHPLATT